MDVGSTIGLGWLLGAWQVARVLWPNGPLYSEPWVYLHPGLIGALAALLLLGGLYRRRAEQARRLVGADLERLAAERDVWVRAAATAMKEGVTIGIDTGRDQARREYLRRARLKAS